MRFFNENVCIFDISACRNDRVSPSPEKSSETDHLRWTPITGLVYYGGDQNLNPKHTGTISRQIVQI